MLLGFITEFKLKIISIGPIFKILVDELVLIAFGVFGEFWHDIV